MAQAMIFQDWSVIMRSFVSFVSIDFLNLLRMVVALIVHQTKSKQSNLMFTKILHIKRLFGSDKELLNYFVSIRLECEDYVFEVLEQSSC